MQTPPQSIRIKAMRRDFGVVHPVSISVRSDSTAAISIAQRRGFGKVRHTEVNQLWLQERVAKREITLVKVPGDTNAVDHLTKPGCTAAVSKLMDLTSQRIVDGRHHKMPAGAHSRPPPGSAVKSHSRPYCGCPDEWYRTIGKLARTHGVSQTDDNH